VEAQPADAYGNANGNTKPAQQGYYQRMRL
jgi:hypothetical protein